MNTSRHVASILVACAVALGVQAQTTYDRHVIFDNALADGGYESSNGFFVAPSSLESPGGKFPIDRDHFVSPPTALRLKWLSAPGGDWQMTIQITRRYARPFKFEGDALTFWCFSDF